MLGILVLGAGRLTAGAADEVAADTVPKPSPFAPTIPNPGPAPTNAPAGMVWIPGGEFSMGCLTPNDGICTIATMQSVQDFRNPSIAFTWMVSGWTRRM